MEKIWYLKRLDIFSGLPEEFIQSIDKNSRMFVCEKREKIYTGEELSNNVFIVKSGKVVLYRETEDGKRFIFGVLGKGEIFGSLLTEEEKQNEYALIEPDTVLCIMSKDFFEKILQQNPVLSIRISRLFGLRVYEMEVLLQEIAFKPVISRLAYIIDKLVNKFGVKGKKGRRINIKLTHEEIASMIGATRESVTKTLNELKKEGVIDIENRKITVIDMEKLRKFKSVK